VASAALMRPAPMVDLSGQALRKMLNERAACEAKHPEM
jgi:hypothetical protein